MVIKIKYHGESEKLCRIEGEKSNWIDLRAAEDVFIPYGEFAMIPLGISMELPTGYEAHVLPRSSTFKKWGIIMTNSMGIIDNSYCGDNDVWQFPAWCIDSRTHKNAKRGTMIHKGDRICQFRIMPIQPEIKFVEVEHLGNPDRGSFGSTGER